MRTLGKTLAVLCAVLFVLTAIVALFLFNIEQRAFSSKTYKQVFEQHNLYERMPSVLAISLKESVAEQAGAAPLKAISQEGWEKTLSALLPPEELKALTNEALDSTFDYLNGKTDSASISLLPFKRHMAGDSGVEAVQQLLGAQPACTEEQVMQMGLNLISGGEMLLCNPPAELLGMFDPMIESQLQFMTIGIPDELTIIKGTQSGTPNDPRLALNRVRTIMKLTPILPLLFLFGLTVLAVRSLTGWLKWWGIPFAITGAISALVALLGSPVLSVFIQSAIRNRGGDSIPPALVSMVQEIVGAVSRQILRPVAIEGFILLTLGLVTIVVAAYLSKREKTVVPAQP